MADLLWIELYKTFRKPRSYIGIVAIALIGAVIHLAIGLEGEQYLNLLLEQIQQSLQIHGKIINGNLAGWVILQSLILHLPLLVALVAGDLISGEASAGTLRLLASKPVRRAQIVLAKFFAAAAYTIVLVGWLGVVAVGGGQLAMGQGDLIVLGSDQIFLLPAADVGWRFLLAMVLAGVGLTTVAALALMLSTFANNSLGPIMATMSVVILFTIIGTMEFPLFQQISPWLFTTHMSIWRELFHDPVDAWQIVQSVLFLSLHIIIFVVVTVIAFSRRDILT